MDFQFCESAIMFLCAICLLYGLVPLILTPEVYHWIIRRNYVAKPLLIGAILGLIWGIFSIIIMIATSSGESGLALIAFIPFIVLGFVILGLSVGFIYKTMKRTILQKK